jgi:hypothetical protein
MNHINDTPSYDPYANEIAAMAGQPTDRDPFSEDREVAKRTAQERQAAELRAQNKLHLAHQALNTSASSAPGYSDPNAPKRDRVKLRRPL